MPLATHSSQSFHFHIPHNCYLWFSSNISECSFSFFFTYFLCAVPPLGRMLQGTTQIPFRRKHYSPRQLGLLPEAGPWLPALFGHCLGSKQLLHPRSHFTKGEPTTKDWLTQGHWDPLTSNLKNHSCSRGFANQLGCLMLSLTLLSNHASSPFLLQVCIPQELPNKYPAS